MQSLCPNIKKYYGRVQYCPQDYYQSINLSCGQLFYNDWRHWIDWKNGECKCLKVVCCATLVRLRLCRTYSLHVDTRAKCGRLSSDGQEFRGRYWIGMLKYIGLQTKSKEINQGWKSLVGYFLLQSTMYERKAMLEDFSKMHNHVRHG